MSLPSLLPWLPDLAQPASIAGLMALGSACTWPLLRQRRAILSVQVLCSLLFALHYLLLGAPTAAAMCMAGVAQGIAVVALRGRALRIGVVGLTAVAAAGATALTWTGLPSALSLAGQLGGAVGRLQTDTQRLRLCFMVSVLFWTAHNLMVGSVFGLGSDTLSLTALALGFLRDRRARRVVSRAGRPAPAGA
ncbi:YgjV family protein [Falsiroseomonas sp. CW058]|uniref:YgjV family protein n=1 Tax=Falsiroseomonas sp. CW058 TaxID=3388664 RepID=UPI003D31D335